MDPKLEVKLALKLIIGKQKAKEIRKSVFENKIHLKNTDNRFLETEHKAQKGGFQVKTK